ncbi:hypothetical protein G9P44_001447 [Scheffersomyces stipitis]|nr:hypothetical protein G9P44_001447 [Scheffersomyces stipitis]
MTMSASQSEVEYLASTLIKNEQPVTYQSLSRELGVHVNHAKLVLSEFYEKNKDKLTASFVITGRNSNRTLIKLSRNEETLENDVAQFDRVTTIHIYCVHSKQVIFSNNEIAFEELKHPIDSSKTEIYIKNGLIKGPTVKEVEKSTLPIPTPTKTSATRPPASVPTSTAAKPAKSAGITSSYVSRKQAANDKKVNTLSNYTSRKEESKRKPVEQASSGYQYKSRKLDTKTPKERVIVSNHGPDDDVEAEDDFVPTSKSASKKGDLEKLFEDEFSDFEDDSVLDNAEPIAVDDNIVNEVEKLEVNDETASQTSPQITSRQQSTEPESLPEKEEEEEITQEVDEDGYIVTSKKARPSAVKPAAKRTFSPASSAAKKAKATSGKKTQTNLMSFFGKK